MSSVTLQRKTAKSDIGIRWDITPAFFTKKSHRASESGVNLIQVGANRSIGTQGVFLVKSLVLRAM